MTYLLLRAGTYDNDMNPVTVLDDHELNEVLNGSYGITKFCAEFPSSGSPHDLPEGHAILLKYQIVVLQVVKEEDQSVD